MRGVGAAAGEDGGAARAADSDLDVGVTEDQALVEEPLVEVRRQDLGGGLLRGVVGAAEERPEVVDREHQAAGTHSSQKEREKKSGRKPGLRRRSRS